MNSKKIFSKVLSKLSGIMIQSSAASSCGMGNEEMPECLKKLR